MLRDKEIMIINVGAKIGIGYGRDYSALTGSKELTADRKRLLKLCERGYFLIDWHNGKKIYFLSSKGLNEVDSHRRQPYDPKGYITEHDLYVSEFAAYIHLKTGISYESFIFDCEMENVKGLKPARTYSEIKNGADSSSHAPDFIVGNRCYEVELNNKSKDRLEKNFEINAKHFEKQVWLVQGRMKSLQHRIKSLADKYRCPTQIITVEQIDRYMQSVDLKSNEIGRHVDFRIKEDTQKSILEELF